VLGGLGDAIRRAFMCGRRHDHLRAEAFRYVSNLLVARCHVDFIKP